MGAARAPNRNRRRCPRAREPKRQQQQRGSEPAPRRRRARQHDASARLLDCQSGVAARVTEKSTAVRAFRGFRRCFRGVIVPVHDCTVSQRNIVN